jgi:hypothetical protein
MGGDGAASIPLGGGRQDSRRDVAPLESPVGEKAIAPTAASMYM